MKPCYICDEYVETHFERRSVMVNRNGIKFNVRAKREICDKCGNEIFNLKLDNRLSNKALKKYRKLERKE